MQSNSQSTGLEVVLRETPAQALTQFRFHGYCALEVIPITWKPGDCRTSADPTFQIAAHKIIEGLTRRYGVKPSNYSPGMTLDGYVASITGRDEHKYELGTAVVYTWMPNFRGDNAVTHDSKGRNDSLQVTIVRHPDNKDIYAFQVVRSWTAEKGGESELFDTGLFWQGRTVMTSKTKGAEYSHALARRQS
jgi:hypothetical protein